MVSTKPISIVTGRLIPKGPTTVTATFDGNVAKELQQLESELKSYNQKQNRSTADNYWKLWLEDRIAKVQEYLKNCKVTQYITEYTDSKGANYVETIEKQGSFGTGTPVRTLVKTEEECLKDGRKIITTTTHDKSDHRLMGEGHQDGLIEAIENIYTKEKVNIGRITTTQQASGYGGKTVKRELSKDGCELAEHNTVCTITHVDNNGIKLDRTTYEPGDVYGITVECNEHGIPQIPQDSIKAGW